MCIVWYMIDVPEGLSLTEVEKNDCNDIPACYDNAPKVVA